MLNCINTTVFSDSYKSLCRVDNLNNVLLYNLDMDTSTLVHTTSKLFLRAEVLTFGPMWGESKSRPSVGRGHVVGHVVHDVVHIFGPYGACGPCLWTMWSPSPSAPLCAPLRPARIWTTMVGRAKNRAKIGDLRKKKCPLRGASPFGVVEGRAPRGLRGFVRFHCACPRDKDRPISSC